MMNKQKGWRIAAAVLAGLLLLSAFVIQRAGGRGPLPSWQQLRAALGVPLRTEESAPKPAPGSTAVYVLDVGQGDAVLICQDGAYCLIDTGPAEAEEALLYDLHALDVESLDYLVLTHPHADHTGNARAVLSDFPVKQLLLPLWEPGADDTADWPRRLAESAAENGTELITAEAGDRYPLGGGTTRRSCRAAAEMPQASTIFRSVRCSRPETSAFSTPAMPRKLPSSGFLIPTVLPCMLCFTRQGITGRIPPTVQPFCRLSGLPPWPSAAGLIMITATPTAPHLKILRPSGPKVYRTDQEGSLTFLRQNNTLQRGDHRRCLRSCGVITRSNSFADHRTIQSQTLCFLDRVLSAETDHPDGQAGSQPGSRCRRSIPASSASPSAQVALPAAFPLPRLPTISRTSCTSPRLRI